MSVPKLAASVAGAGIILFIVVGFLSTAHDRRDQGLRDDATVLRTTVRQTNRDLDLLRLQTAQDSFLIAGLREDITQLEEEADAATISTLEALDLREGARSAVQEDTLAPALRNLLLTERTVAVSYKRELRIANARITKLDSIVRVETARADNATSLLWAVQAERDAGLSIISAHEKRWDFSLSRLLFRDLPRKAACAGGGAAVAAMNKGDVLVGAGVGLLACLLVESVL